MVFLRLVVGTKEGVNIMDLYIDLYIDSFETRLVSMKEGLGTLC